MVSGNALMRRIPRTRCPVKSKIVASKSVESPLGKPAFHRYVEVHYPSMAALQASLASPGGKETAAHAVSISSGGTPTFFIAEEQVFEF
jgi:hypothetical protein